RRFRRELSVVSSLRCRGLADVYVTGLVQWNGADCFWIAMELLEGGRIDHYVDANKLSEKEVLTLLLAIAKTLQATHRGGVIHCDLKPSNILMSFDGYPHLVDFGVATNVSRDQTTESGMHLAGTAAWMAPELILGETRFADTRTDIYSFGLIAWRLLTGQHPYEAEGKPFPEVAKIARERPSLRLNRLGYHASRDLTTFVERLTERDPAQRYQHMDHVAEDLQRLLKGEPISIRRVSLAERSWRWCRQHFALSFLVLVTILSVAWAAGMAIVSAAREREYTRNLEHSKSELEQANRELVDTNDTLHLLADRRQRSLLSARLRELSANQVSSGPGEIHRWLNDETLFPREFRGFAWQVLDEQSRPDVYCLNFGSHRVFTIRFSHDGNLIAAVLRDGRLCLGEIHSGAVLWQAEGVAIGSQIRFSPDDKWLFGFTTDRRICRWSTVTGLAADTVVSDNQFRPSLMDLDSKSGMLAVVTDSNNLMLIDQDAQSTNSRPLPVDTAAVSIWFENGGKVLCGLTKEGLCHEWSVPDLQPIGITNLPSANDIPVNVFTGTGTTDRFGQPVRTGSDGRSIAWAAFPASGLPCRTFPMRGVEIKAISLVPPNDLLVTTTKKSQLLPLFSMGPGREYAAPDTQSYCNAVSDDATTIAIGDDHGNVRIYGLSVPDVRKHSIASWNEWAGVVDGYPTMTTMSGDGGSIYATFSQGMVVHAAASGARILQKAAPTTVPLTSLLLSPDETWLACGIGGNRSSGGVAVFQTHPSISNGDTAGASDATELQQIASVESASVRRLALSTDGRHVFAAHRNGSISVIDTRTWEVTHNWFAHEAGVYALIVHNGIVISGGTDGGICFWSEADFTQIRSWNAHEGRIYQLCFSPDGKRLYSCSHDRTAAIWSSDGTLIQRIHGHSGPLRAIAVSEDGDTLATGSDDYTIRLWDGQTGAAQITLRHGGDFVSDLRFNGNELISASFNGTIEFWGPK
ncbi:MAG: protein kinase, partial [Planctomycetaceae bacterium]|nr:protein kinase [Planctomycetaceae bacterium]